MSAKKNVTKKKSVSKQKSVKKDSKYWVNIIGSVFSWAVILTIFFGLAFYLPDEYYDVALWKFYYLFNACRIILIAFGFFLLVYFAGRGLELADIPDFKPIAKIDAAVVVFLFFAVISYFLSDYKSVYIGDDRWPAEGALYGTDGWFIGLITYLIIVFLYFIVAHFLKFSKWVLIPVVGSATVMFLWGALNRFGISLLIWDGQESWLLASLGNLNWFSGYLSVLFPLSVGLYWYKESGLKVLYGALVAVGSIMAVINGSDSIVFALAILFVFLAFVSFRDETRFKAFAEIVLIFGVANMLMSIASRKITGLLTYNGQFSAIVLKTKVALAILIIGIILFVLSLLFSKKVLQYPAFFKNCMGWIIVSLTAIGIICMIVLITVNTKLGGTLPVIGSNRLFVFNDSWGSGRGIIWSQGVREFLSLSFDKKLFGVGPDCFYHATVANAPLFEEIKAYYTSARLTNCHNTLLTMLINVGILGTLSFGSIFYFVYKACMSRVDEHPELMMFPFVIVMYLANNVVSFQTVSNLPYLFIVFGIAASMLVKIERQGQD